MFLRRLFRRRSAVIGLLLVLAFCLLALLAPVLAPPLNPDDPWPFKNVSQSFSRQPLPPEPGLPLGTTPQIQNMPQYGIAPGQDASYQWDVYYTLVWGSRSALRFGLVFTLATVSYTHLDVYKRQDGNTGERVGGVLRGDLGYSRSGREPVIDVLIRRMPATLELALWAMIPVIAFGIWLGVKAALNHNKLFDQVARIFAIIGDVYKRQHLDHPRSGRHRRHGGQDRRHVLRLHRRTSPSARPL